jgi:thiol:disulfide interchange protein DsbD
MTLLAAVQAGMSETLQHDPVLALLTLFGAGVLTGFTPCVFPMIPITAGIIAGTAGATPARWRVVSVTLTYVLGLALLYATLGLLAGLTGTLFGTVSANPWARVAIGNLLLVFALIMLDVVPVSAPHLQGGSYPAVFLLGATSGVVAAPCTAAPFAAVLTWVSTTGSPTLGFVYLFVFSLGMTALLVAVGLFSGLLARLPRSGRWLVWIKRAAGLILLAMAEYYFIQAGMVW